jgi:phosphoribosylanthranilate isomerase
MENKTIKLKVCGMRESENIRQVAALLPDYMGFIFYKPSKRYAGDVLDKAVLDSMPASIIKTGVFVNETYDEVMRISTHFGLRAVQLHGKERPALCQQLQQKGLHVMKVLHVEKEIDTEVLKTYEDCCDYFLFDTADAAWGGTGRTFDWKVLDTYSAAKPFFLSGGIDIDHLPLPAGVLAKPLWALDINSKFELRPGLKDVEKIKAFKEKMKEL